MKKVFETFMSVTLTVIIVVTLIFGVVYQTAIDNGVYHNERINNLQIQTK